MYSRTAPGGVTPAEPAKVEEAAQVETATADLGTAPPPAEGETAAAEAAAIETLAAPIETAEPQFDEVWFPGGRRPDTPRHQNRRPPRDAAAPDGAARPPRRFHRDSGANGQPAEGGDKPQAEAKPRFDKRPKPFGADKKPFDKPKFGGKRERDREDWREHRPREKRDVALDPDSPWAALAALRNPKPE